jgi:transketolase
MKPSIRLASLMQLHVIYVFTHDSLGVGEDGPTHQPVEQLAMLRAVPGLTVIRPADANETVEAWKVALEASGPVALALTRQSVPVLERPPLSDASGLARGAYIIAGEHDQFDILLIATGSEVSLALEAREKLYKNGVSARVVSMPSWELFEAQDDEYRDRVLPREVGARLVVEAGVTQGWSKYAGDAGDIIGVDRFGVSAPGGLALAHLGFTVEEVVARSMKLLGHTD